MRENFVRGLKTRIQEALGAFPAVELIGPRQCGKSTPARRTVGATRGAACLDLDLDSDARKLTNAEAFRDTHPGQLVCLDEIRRAPDLSSSSSNRPS